MNKYLFLFLSLGLILYARENPFFPINPSDDFSLTSNQVQTYPPLKQATITLPSKARVLESVTIRYKNLDGTVEEKKLHLNNSIDWHLPLFISQNYQLQTKEQKTVTKFRKIAELSFVSFYENNKKLKIMTQDKLLRHFVLVKPHRIVCDFQRDTHIRSYVKKTPQGSLFRQIRVGTHDGYYRVVVELDGYYMYSIKKNKQGYMVELY